MKPWVVPVGLLLVMTVACGKQEPLPVPMKVSVPSSSLNERKPLTDYPDQWLGTKTITVAPGVHVLNRLRPSAAFAIETKAGLILIDAGALEFGEVVRESFYELGLRVDELRYILLTHAHYDHVLGANKFRSASGATVCAGRDDCQVLRQPDMDALYSIFPRVAYSGDPIEVDRELADGDVIELGGVTIEVLATPGHTPGSVCYLLHKDDQRILFSGDVIASLNYGPATYSAHISPRFRGDAESYLNTINRFLEMEPPDLLLAGHPRQQNKQMYSIRLDKKQWEQLLRPAQAELQLAVDRHRKDGADFLDDQAKQIERGLWLLGMLDGTAIYCIDSEHQLVVINAPGGDKFAQFLRNQLDSIGMKEREPDLVLLTSRDERDWSGLTSLQSAPKVVAHPTAFRAVLKAGVENVTPPDGVADLAAAGVDHLSLGDSLAYSLVVNDKNVLITPRVPRKLSFPWKDRWTSQAKPAPLSPQWKDFKRDLSESQQAADLYRDALDDLQDLSPDIWLPAIPAIGQNANIYDDQWEHMIEYNRSQIPTF